MRFLDEDSDKKIDRASLFLTKEEAEQMYSYLGDLLKNPSDQHFHLSSEDYQKEITICLYDISDLSYLHERAKKLIEKDV